MCLCEPVIGPLPINVGLDGCKETAVSMLTNSYRQCHHLSLCFIKIITMSLFRCYIATRKHLRESAPDVRPPILIPNQLLKGLSKLPMKLFYQILIFVVPFLHRFLHTRLTELLEVPKNKKKLKKEGKADKTLKVVASVCIGQTWCQTKCFDIAISIKINIK